MLFEQKNKDNELHMSIQYKHEITSLYCIFFLSSGKLYLIAFSLTVEKEKILLYIDLTSKIQSGIMAKRPSNNSYLQHKYV